MGRAARWAEGWLAGGPRGRGLAIVVAFLLSSAAVLALLVPAVDWRGPSLQAAREGVPESAGQQRRLEGEATPRVSKWATKGVSESARKQQRLEGKATSRVRKWTTKVRRRAEGMITGGERGPPIDTCFDLQKPLRKLWPNSRKGKRRCLPHFMLFGLGHSGSSTLSQLLQVHPDVDWNVDWAPGSTSHEVRYWRRRRNAPRSRDAWGHFFDILPPGSQMRLGGKSPAVGLNGKRVAADILKMAPWLKVVMFMREPLEWTTSVFYLKPKKVETWAKEYVESLRTSGDAGHKSTRMGGEECLTQMRAHTRFREFVDVFPREQVFLASQEELLSDRDAMMAKLEDFLGLRHIDWGRLVPAETKFHRIATTPDVSVATRCLVDVCGRGVAQAWEDMLWNYTGRQAMYSPEKRQFWKDRGALTHTPPVNETACRAEFRSLGLPETVPWP